jgi:hypothetical protein
VGEKTDLFVFKMADLGSIADFGSPTKTAFPLVSQHNQPSLLNSAPIHLPSPRPTSIALSVIKL